MANVAKKWRDSISDDIFKSVFFETEDEAVKFKSTLKYGKLYKGIPRSRTRDDFNYEASRFNMDTKKYKYVVVYRCKFEEA